MFAADRDPLRSPRVLVIEDSPVIRRLIEVCLRPLASDLTLASDGQAGLQSAVVDRPDVIVLDIGLPGISGWEVLDRLREGKLTADIPVILLTGHVEEFDLVDTQRGAAAFMTKPFQPEALRRQVIGLLPSDGVDVSPEVP